MRVCVLGNVESAELDEGMKNVAYHFSRELSKQNQVLELDLRDFLKLDFWKRIKTFNPEIFHYFAGPTLVSLVLLRLINWKYKYSKMVVSALHPWFPGITKGLIRFFKPDLVLINSNETEELFRRAGCRTGFLPNGVSLQKFRLISDKTKEELRRKYGIPVNKRILLHVGAVKRERGVWEFTHLDNPDWHVVVVGSSSAGIDQKLVTDLEQKGITVITEYLPEIEEMYNMADCYLFPTENRLNAIEIPLTILEALACGLPVVSYDFGGITRVVEPGNGFFIYSDQTNMKTCVETALAKDPGAVREKVSELDWENVASILNGYYQKILGEQ